MTIAVTAAAVMSDLKLWLKMKISAIALVLPSLLTGCIPLQQYEISGTREFEYLSVDGSYFIEQLGPSNKAKVNKIIANESYAISPSKKRFRVELEPHDYDISRNFPYIRDRIYLLNDHGKRIGSIGNGTWTLFLMIDSGARKEFREFTAKVWTFYYNPIFHGAPN